LVTIADEAAPLIRPSAIAAVLEQAAASIWLVGVALSPVWFGSNIPLVWGANAALFGAALGIYALGAIAVPRPFPVPLGWFWLALAAIAIVLGWAAIQILPGIPGSAWNPVWTKASEALGTPVEGAISVYPTGGRMAVLWAATAAVVFFLAVQLGRDRARARIILYVMALSGGAIAAYGLAIYFEGNQWVLWQPKHAYRNALTATFINKNNYAAFAGMGLTCAFGLLLARLPRASPEETRRPRGELLVHSLAVVALGVVFAVDCAALILAGSRGGAAVTVLGMTVLLLLWLTRQPAWRRPIYIAFGLTALGIIVFAASSSALLASRLPNFDEDLATRLAVDARTIAAIKAAPWTGYGLGAFQQAFAAFRDATLSTQGRWEYAHNDWLEALMTLGIPVGLLVWLIFGWMLVRCLDGAINRGRDAIYPAIGAGVCVLAFVHSLIDFTMQIQGFAFPFLAIVGVGVAQSWSSRRVAGHPGQGGLAAHTTLR
jgi:O-antigen ligase